MNNLFFLIALFTCCYLFGNINFALIISKIINKDIRKVGSGNPGTLNVIRSFGAKLGLLTLFFDMLKGAVVVIATYFIFRNCFCFIDFAIVLAGFSVILGHIYPVFLKFKGGKGIASSVGFLIASSIIFGRIYIIILSIAVVVAIIFVYFTELGAIGSFIAILPSYLFLILKFVLYCFSSEKVFEQVLAVFAICLIITLCIIMLLKHKQNFKRIKAGIENPTSIKKMFKKNK